MNPRVQRSVRVGIATLCLIAGASGTGRAAEDTAAEPLDLTTVGIEAVMNMEVTSVSKRPERLMDAPAAIQVITSEDIRRSGATSLPDLLRLVPGVQVARVDASTWAVGVRGFTSTLSRSLLILIDGRSVYSPLFAGVYWDVQDTALNDIERIEVIRGPGATLWGANAVNGVINVITKSARETQGGYLSARAGNEDRVVATGRYGGRTAGGTAWRAYGKYVDRDAEFHADGDDYDGWHMARAGFRMDADPREADHLTLQGELYSGRAGQRTANSTYSAPYIEVVEEDADLSGGNLLGRWERRSSDRADFTLQGYYDRTNRNQPGFREDRDTIDLEFRNHLRVASRHDILWGAGYRLTSGRTGGVPTIEFAPADRTDDVWSAFVQDEIRIVPAKLTLTVGSKFEHNDYSGFNVQPNVRASYTPAPRHMLWAAVSRALRVPSRIETDLSLTALLEPSTPTFVRVTGNKDFDPERLTAYEIGYRVKPGEKLFLDLAIFYDDYSRLMSIEPGTPFGEATPPPAHTIVPYVFDNKVEAQVYGAEIAADWRPVAAWRLTASYAFLHMDLRQTADSLDPTTVATTEGSSPRHLATLRSSLDLPRSFSLDATLRYVGRLPAQGVDAYTEMDLAFGRDLSGGYEVSIVGQNLLSARHAEFGGGVEVERSLFGRIVKRW